MPKTAMSDRPWPAAALALVAILLATPSSAVADDDDAWQALRQDGAIAVMRHALAPGTGDPAGFTLGDCSTQRNLNAAGRAQARAVGAAFRAHGIEVDRVLTSQWCRCRETAELLDLGPVEDLPALNSFFADRSTRDRQTREARAFLADLEAYERVVLVTHQVNITALTGTFAASGELIVIRLDDARQVEVLDRVLIRP